MQGLGCDGHIAVPKHGQRKEIEMSYCEYEEAARDRTIRLQWIRGEEYWTTANTQKMCCQKLVKVFRSILFHCFNSSHLYNFFPRFSFFVMYKTVISRSFELLSL